jgi:hypothetical protein
MNSIVQCPQEILLLIITRCDGLSLERLSRTSKVFKRLMDEYIAGASYAELLRKTIPIFEQRINEPYIINAHFHRLPNAEFHGKFEIYCKRCIYENTYTVNTRIWLDHNYLIKVNLISAYLGGRSLYENYRSFARIYEQMWKKIQISQMVFRKIGIKRKRGQYFLKN